jgi:hypothetical protein
MNSLENTVNTNDTERIRVPIRLPRKLISIIDEVAVMQMKDRTQFIEDAIRKELNHLNIVIKTKDTPKFCDDADLEMTEEQSNIETRKLKLTSPMYRKLHNIQVMQ